MTLECRHCAEHWTPESFHTEVRARLHGAYAHDLPPESRDWGVSGTDQGYHQLYAQVTVEFSAIGCGALTINEAGCTRIDPGHPDPACETAGNI